jgi:hypothetical protein
MHADHPVPPVAGSGRAAPLGARPAGRPAHRAANRDMARFTGPGQDLSLPARAQPEVADLIRSVRRAPGLPGELAAMSSAAALASRAPGTA